MKTAKDVLIKAVEIYSIAGVSVLSKSPELTMALVDFDYSNVDQADSAVLKKTGLAVLKEGPTTQLAVMLKASAYARYLDQIVERNRAAIEDNLRPAVIEFCRRASIPF